MGQLIKKVDPSDVDFPLDGQPPVRRVPLRHGFCLPLFGFELRIDGSVSWRTTAWKRLPSFPGEISERTGIASLGEPIALSIFEIAPAYNCYTFAQPLGNDHTHTYLYRKRGDTKIYWWSESTGFRFSVDFVRPENRWYAYFVDNMFPFETFEDTVLKGMRRITLEHASFNGNTHIALGGGRVELISDLRHVSVRVLGNLYSRSAEIDNRDDVCELFSRKDSDVVVLADKLQQFSRVFESHFVRKSEFVYGKFWSELLFEITPLDQESQPCEASVAKQLELLEKWRSPGTVRKDRMSVDDLTRRGKFLLSLPIRLKRNYPTCTAFFVLFFLKEAIAGWAMLLDLFSI